MSGPTILDRILDAAQAFELVAYAELNADKGPIVSIRRRRDGHELFALSREAYEMCRIASSRVPRLANSL